MTANLISKLVSFLSLRTRQGIGKFLLQLPGAESQGHCHNPESHKSWTSPCPPIITSLSLWMWELVLKEGLVPKNWYFRIVLEKTFVLKEGLVPKNWCFRIVLEKTFESPLNSKEIKPVNPKPWNKPWIFIGRKAPVLWPPDVKSWLIEKDPDAEKDWWQ